MTSRERQLAAVRHEPTDRVPVDAIAIEIVPEIAEFLSIEPGQVLGRLGIDGRIVGAGFAGEHPLSTAGEQLSEWHTSDAVDYGTSHGYPLDAAETVADIEAFRWPDPADYDYARAREVCAGLAQYARRGPYWLPVFCRAAEMMGLERVLVTMRLAPGVLEAVLTHITDLVAEYCERLLRTCGDELDILCLGDDFATQRGMLMDPADWRRFLRPHYARLFALGARYGKPVWFHSCGDVTPVLPDLIDIGANVWETVQLHALPMSAEALKREFGRHLTFFGGVNTQRLPFATPIEVADEVRRVIRTLGEGGGLILGPDHHIKPDVPAANAVALFDAALGYDGAS